MRVCSRTRTLARARASVARRVLEAVAEYACFFLTVEVVVVPRAWGDFRVAVAADDASTLSCADFNAAASQVLPPPDASEVQRRRAVEAQDYLGNGMVWLHG